MSRNDKEMTEVASDGAVVMCIQQSVSRHACLGVSESGSGSRSGSKAIIVEGGSVPNF